MIRLLMLQVVLLLSGCASFMEPSPPGIDTSWADEINKERHQRDQAAVYRCPRGDGVYNIAPYYFFCS